MTDLRKQLLRLRASRPARRLAREDGQAMVEFALIALLFISLIVLLAQVGFWFQAKSTLRDAVRSAARQASLCRSTASPTPTAIYTQIATSSLASGKVTAPSIVFSNGCNVGSKVTVTGTFDFSVGLAKFPTFSLPASKLTTTAVAVVE